MTTGVSFIHLSDIHFNKHSGDIYDIDLDLRNEIERDINNYAKSTLENIKGILVCGDIAFSGTEREYNTAQAFLSNICLILNISETAVFCVPGNHDVDQSVARNSQALYKLQKDIESENNPDALEDKLTKYLRDPLCKDIIFGHIDAYNTKFAGQYQCNINTEKPFWAQDVTLDDDFTLRIHGMNSTIISSADDHSNRSEERPMIIGQYQIPQRKEGIAYLILCHHPPEFWKDPGDILKSKINNRVAIQLYGHKHIQEITKVENSLIVGSGATHPSRWDGEWVPRYNWLSIHVETSGSDHLLNIKIYPRVLDKDSDKFVVDSSACGSNDYVQYTLKLNDDNNTVSTEKADLYQHEFPEVDVKVNEAIPSSNDNLDTKTLVYRFMNLSYLTRTTILSKLNLLDEEDEGVNHVDILQKILQKAKTRNLLEEMWILIDR